MGLTLIVIGVSILLFGLVLAIKAVNNQEQKVSALTIIIVVVGFILAIYGGIITPSTHKSMKSEQIEDEKNINEDINDLSK